MEYKSNTTKIVLSFQYTTPTPPRDDYQQTLGSSKRKKGVLVLFVAVLMFLYGRYSDSWLVEFLL